MHTREGAKFGRKKILVRLDREKIEPGHRQWRYRTHEAQNDGTGRVGVMPSSQLHPFLIKYTGLLA
jgi:hypothetical protein